MNRQKSFQNDQEAALYLVPTPIGNLSEVSERTKVVLEEVDAVACEDTRNTGSLLKKLNIQKPLLSHHEHNQSLSIPKIMDLLKEGKKVAVVSDAGYPLVSDPGAALVKEAIKNNFCVIPLSGPNAALGALVASGLDSSHYLYYGFLESKSSKRVKQLEALKDIPFTILFYEAPHRITEMLTDLLEVFGDRQICLARELTKLYEEFIRGSISEVLTTTESLKGEMVVVVEGKSIASESCSIDDALQKMEEYIESGKKTKQAALQVSEETGLSKNTLYQAFIQRK